jgi:hypothetical protein
MMEKAKECYLKEAEKFMAVEDYTGAVIDYRHANLSLTTIPKEPQEKMLELIRTGNVEATQCLASLVKSEEDELIFNEARAGMVL